MIVPANRLLWWFALGVLPFLTLASMLPGVGVWCWVPVLGVLGLASGDAWRGWSLRRGVTVELPTMVRLFVGRAGQIEIVVRADDERARSLKLGLPWPEGVEGEPKELSVACRAGEAKHRFGWTFRGWQRGRFVVESCYLQTESPWGFWLVRSRHEQQCEIRLYPDVLSERHRVTSLFLRRGVTGLRRHRVVGKGREFEKLRDYVPGDSYDDIHWKATARRRRPVTKLFQVERTQEVYVLLDTSRLLGRMTAAGREGDPRASASALERWVTATLLLMLAAKRQGDRFGLMVFADRVQGFLRAKSGHQHFAACREMLLGVEQSDAAPDFEELFSWVRVRLRHRALLVVFTALDDPVVAETFERSVALVSRQHLVLVQQLQPRGVAPLFGDEAPETLEEIYEQLAGHVRWHALRECQGRLQRKGVRLSFPEETTVCAELVRRYLEVKDRQAL